MIQEHGLDLATASVGEIALNLPESIGVLNRYQLDYCCGGNVAFVDACAVAHLNAPEVWNEILASQTFSVGNTHMKFGRWKTSFLIDFLEQHHHDYVRETIPVLTELLNKICAVHAQEHEELIDVRDTFQALALELLGHLPKEEMVLFPAIRRMLHEEELAKDDLSRFPLQAPLDVMEHEHESAGDLLKQLRKLTKNYQPPAGACTTYQAAFQLLRQFDDDLIQHIHIENNILFPKVRLVRK